MKIILQATMKIFLIATLAVSLNSAPYCISGGFLDSVFLCIACGEGYVDIDQTCKALPDDIINDNCLEYERTWGSGIRCSKVKEGFKINNNNEIVPIEIPGCAIEAINNGVAYCQACFDGKEFLGVPPSCQEPNDVDKIENCLIVSISHITEWFLNIGVPLDEEIKNQLKRKCRLCDDGYSVYKKEFSQETNPRIAERCKTGPPNCFELRDEHSDNCLKCKYGFRLTQEFKCINVEGGAQQELI
jgi:hypothetical protein